MPRILFIPIFNCRALIFLLLVSSGVTAWSHSQAQEASERNNLISAQLINVVNGGTIIVRINGANDRLSLLGVDMLNPQLPIPPGKRHGIKTSSLWGLFKGEHVLLAFPFPYRDQYSRMPAYVYRQSDLLFLNYEIIRQGYGRTHRHNTFKYRNIFLHAEHEACQEGAGLWKSRLSAEEQIARKPRLPLPQEIFACDTNPDN